MDYRKPNNQAKAAPESRKGPSQMWRPASHAKSAQGARCPHCNAEVKASYAVCPECGRSLTPGKCSFCGAAMRPGMKFCTQCGQSSEGVICPECGTLNSRNFCRKCNTPLTPGGLKAIEAARCDPAYLAAVQKARELAEMHAMIEELQQEAQRTQTEVGLSDADKALLDEYADILGSIGAYAPRPTETRQAEPQPGRCVYQDKAMNLEEIMAAYREKSQEMNDALAAMVPPPEFTPEQQRDYYSARKVASIHNEYATDWSNYHPTLWQCNYCGFKHHQPSECCEPQLGGVWLFVSPEEYEREHSQIVSQSLIIQ